MEKCDFKELDSRGREPRLVGRSQWASDPVQWFGTLEGKTLDTGVTVLFYRTEQIGEGPRWHVHPYDEVFIIRSGRALFTIGDKKLEAREGDVLMGPANVPHKYHNLGPGTLETTDIHLSDRWIQADLDDPES
ncbi:cupin domain-containing protein [Crateriforma conspicua]|uniref:Cupin domain protein n=1 Tax=Crateriforma conspicua TaxID=2527996 RepID=A0A5C5Y1D3_9PLAN|nr:cupin domain-containing protein [Crateriforma conspicua]QDV63468.1 Cupin domain protein [Crateriforma conspicua]TWT69024.1 Cupin domain protein [Crateriforma conspicua]